MTRPIATVGLAAQLGLSAPGGLTYDGTTVGYRVTSPGPGTMPGPVPLRLGSVALTVISGVQFYANVWRQRHALRDH